MKIFEIVEAAKATNPEMFGKVDGPRAARIVIAALREIAKKIEATAEGTVVVARFGQFVVKRAQPKSAPGTGPTLAARMTNPGAARRIIFHPVNPAAAAAKPLKKKT
jgi:hypothetical protein